MEAAKEEFKIGVGADPEVFVIDTEAQRYTSAHDLIPGTKDNPYPVNNGAVQVDGVAAEFNIKPAYTPLEFAQYNTDVMKALRDMIPKKYELVFEPSVRFDKFFFDKLPAEPKELGCNADYNAYTGLVNPRPIPPKSHATMRTGSGHLHISWTQGKDVLDLSHRWDCNYIVKCLQYVVGPYLYLWDKDRDRAKLYGNPGALRYRTYGVEWRTPSNAWLNHPEIWEWLFQVVEWTVRKAKEGVFISNSQLLNAPLSPAFGNTRESLNKRFKIIDKDFPEMPALKKATTNDENPESKGAVRIAHSSTTVNYDVKLDLPKNGRNEYTTPAQAYYADDVMYEDDF